MFFYDELLAIDKILKHLNIPEGNLKQVYVLLIDCKNKH